MKVNEIQNKIPKYVLNVADILISHGYEAHLVGGSVRDILLNKTPKDYDLATNALPEQMEKLFSRAITTNARFGTILVVMDGQGTERFDVEVTTYRTEAEYYSGRWPTKVEFTSSILKDLSRRDFTINAMAINMKDLFDQGVQENEILIDPFGGQKDLKQKIIRAVGNPVERFSEDGLRAYKACRLASELNFSIELKTKKAITKMLNVAKKISMERIRDEFIKLLKYSEQPSYGLELLRETGLLNLFLPELLDCVNVFQPKWHDQDVYWHSLKTMDLAEDSIKITALLHDIGKPATLKKDSSGVHFYGHDVVGSEMSKEILTRLKFSKKTILKTSTLIRWHMFYYPSAEWRKEKNDLESHNNDGGWSDSAIRRFIQKVGEDNIDDLLKLRIADATANKYSTFDPKEIMLLQNRIAKIRANDMKIKISDLEIDGNDLVEMGIPQGPKVGIILNKLLNIIIDKPELNSKQQLVSIVKSDFLK